MAEILFADCIVADLQLRGGRPPTQGTAVRVSGIPFAPAVGNTAYELVHALAYVSCADTKIALALR